jgi:FKBP-type peptidyl-prolyl isomerase-like protein
MTCLRHGANLECGMRSCRFRVSHRHAQTDRPAKSGNCIRNGECTNFPDETLFPPCAWYQTLGIYQHPQLRRGDFWRTSPGAGCVLLLNRLPPNPTAATMKSLFHSFSSAVLLLLLVTGCESPSDKKTPPGSKPVPTAPASAALTPAAAPAPASGRITTASGMQYEVLASGPANGRSPTLNDSVVVHYHGTLPNGTVFDSSIDRGEPITLGVSQVIPGWTEALQLMKPGDKWKLYIPFPLGYGSQSTGKIPAYSDLIFVVQLLKVVGQP